MITGILVRDLGAAARSSPAAPRRATCRFRPATRVIGGIAPRLEAAERSTDGAWAHAPTRAPARPRSRTDAGGRFVHSGRRALASPAQPARPAARGRAARRRGGRRERPRPRRPRPPPAATTAGYVGGLAWLAGDHHIHTQYSSRRHVPGDRPGPARPRVRPGLDGHHRPRQRRARARSAWRRSTRTSVAAREELHGPAHLPGPGVEHPGRRARHGVRAPGPQRGRGAQGVRERLRRHRSPAPARQHPANEAHGRSPASTSSATVRAPQGRRRAVPRQPPGPAAASTRRTSSAAGATPPRTVAVGMEGAPGHQAAGIPTRRTARAAPAASTTTPRRPTSFPGYPLESYRTWGGFDWFTATVGGLWDSLLAEGKPWWITANSDAHVDLPRHRRPRPGQRLRRQRPLQRPGLHGGTPTHGGRLLAGLLQPDPRRRDRRRYARGHGRPAGRPGLGRPRRPDRRPGRPRPGGRRPAAAAARRSAACCASSAGARSS